MIDDSQPVSLVARQSDRTMLARSAKDYRLSRKPETLLINLLTCNTRRCYELNCLGNKQTAANWIAAHRQATDDFTNNAITKNMSVILLELIGSKHSDLGQYLHLKIARGQRLPSLGKKVAPGSCDSTQRISLLILIS